MRKDLKDTVAHRRAALVVAENAVKTQEQWLRRLVASLPDVAWTSTEDGRTIFMSPNVESIFGYSVDELRNSGEVLWFQTIHPDDRQRVIANYRALFSHGQKFDEEFRAQCKDGHWIWVHDRAVRTHEENGMLCADGILSDITARKEAEQSRRSSNERYRLLFENGLAGVFRAEAGGKMLDCNPALARMLGYDSAVELVGGPAADLLFDPAEESGLLGSLSKSGSHNNLELRLRRKDGTFIWGLHNVCLVTPEHGERPCIEGTVIDVTKERQSAAALQNQLSLMEAINTSAPDGLFRLDAEGRVTFANPAGERMLGYATGELQGRVLHDVCHVKSQDRHSPLSSECPITQACASGEALHGYEDVHFRKDGSPVDISFSSAPLYEGKRLVGSVLVMHDITKRKLAEQEFHSLQQQFLQSQKMEAVGRLAGGIAHDFNNLLQIINGYADLLEDKCASSPDLAKLARTIHGAGRRAAVLTKQLLDFSRKDPGVPYVISLDSTMGELMKMVRTLVGSGIDLTTSIRTEGKRVQINAGQLGQVVMNLVVNARDAMPQGGKLHIEASCVDLDDETRKAFGNIAARSYVQLSVSDTGCGMDAEAMTHAFEPFFTTKEPGKGTGLGLSTVYGIVTQNGGGIRVDSAPGVGSTFHICLPIVKREVSVVETQEPPATLGGAERILLAADEKDVTSLIADQLARLGYNVVAASDGAEAFQFVTDAPHSFDMLITDMIMPKMGGQDLAEKIRNTSPTIKVVQMSGYHDAPQRASDDEQPDHPRLQKPFTLEALAEIVRRVLDQKSS